MIWRLIPTENIWWNLIIEYKNKHRSIWWYLEGFHRKALQNHVTLLGLGLENDVITLTIMMKHSKNKGLTIVELTNEKIKVHIPIHGYSNCGVRIDTKCPWNPQLFVSVCNLRVRINSLLTNGINHIELESQWIRHLCWL